MCCTLHVLCEARDGLSAQRAHAGRRAQSDRWCRRVRAARRVRARVPAGAGGLAAERDVGRERSRVLHGAVRAAALLQPARGRLPLALQHSRQVSAGYVRRTALHIRTAQSNLLVLLYYCRRVHYLLLCTVI